VATSILAVTSSGSYLQSAECDLPVWPVDASSCKAAVHCAAFTTASPAHLQSRVPYSRGNELSNSKNRCCFPQVFATILAMITEEVNSMLLDVRSGKAPLAMTGHILLLNWNKQVRQC
jgi:hypothetical protein